MGEASDYVVLDTSAVIEILEDTVKGHHVEDKLKGKTVALPTIVVAEVCSYVARRGADPENVFRLLLKRAHLVDIDSEIAYDGSQLHALAKKKKPKFSLVDAVVVMTGDHLKAQVITCDNDFSGMKNCIVVR